MQALIYSLTSWGADAIVAVQSYSTPVLDALFRAITYLGQEPFVVLIVLIVLWCVGKEQGLRLGMLLLATLCVNVLLKGAIMEPRPHLVHPEIEAKLLYGGYSFPSGHAQISATVWPAMARYLRRRWFTILAAALVLLIAFSRVYLGVHYPHDAIAGLVVGLLVYVASLAALRLARRRVAPGHRSLLVLVGLLAPSVVLAVCTGQDLGTACGLLLGAAVGWALEERCVGFRPRRSGRFCLARIALGASVLGALYAGARASLPPEWAPPVRYGLRLLLYLLAGLVATLGLPWAFRSLSLDNGRERPSV